MLKYGLITISIHHNTKSDFKMQFMFLLATLHAFKQEGTQAQFKLQFKY